MSSTYNLWITFTLLFVICLIHAQAPHVSLGSLGIKPINYNLNSPLQITYTVNSNGVPKEEVKLCTVTIHGKKNSFYAPITKPIGEFQDETTEKIIFLSPAKNDKQHVATDLPSSLSVYLKCGSHVHEEEISLETSIFAQTLWDLYQSRKKPINVVVVGEIGSGKSTLVNSMLTSVQDHSVKLAKSSSLAGHVTKSDRKF